MSDNAGSANSNSWTLLPHEVNIATLRPLAENTELHGGSSCDAERQPPEVAAPAKREHHGDTTLASEEKTSGQCQGEAMPDIAQTTCPNAIPTGDSSTTLTMNSETPPPSLGLPAHSLHRIDIHSQSEGLPECPVGSTPEPDSFSDSYTHISSSSPDELPVPELLGGLEMMEEEEDEEADKMASEVTGSEQRPSQSGSPVEPQVEDGEAKGEAELRRRSLLASLEEIGKEEEEVEEEFQVPHQNVDIGFTVNKCILGAVILLGLGTIFFSGVFMDLDEENDHPSRDLRDIEQLVKQEWQKPEAPQASVDEGIDILNKLVTETQRILDLPAKTLAQEEELNAAKGQAVEGAQEQLRNKEEVQEEHANEDSFLDPATATPAPPVGQRGESRPAVSGTEGGDEKNNVGQSEVKRENTYLRDGVKTQRKAEGRKPRHDQEEGERSKKVKAGWKQKKERGEGKERGHIRGDQVESWKERGDGKGLTGNEKEEKKWKRGKHYEVDGDPNEERNVHETEKKKAKYQREGKESRGKEEERKEWKRGKVERKDWKEEKEWKIGKEERKDWKEEEWKRGREEGKHMAEERERKKGKSDESNKRGEWKQDKEEWKGEKEEWKGKKEEWKKGKDAHKESGKEWKEKNEWKGKGEEKEWRKDSDRKGKRDKDPRWEREVKEERRHQEGKEERKYREGKEEKKHREGKEERKHREGKEERKHREGKEEMKHREGKEERKHREGKEERKHREKEGKAKREERKYANRKEDGKRYSDRGDDVHHQKRQAHHRDHAPHPHHARGESPWQGVGDGEPAHTHRRPSFGQPGYWAHQRERLGRNALPSRHCHSVEDCAWAEGTMPVQLDDFEALLEEYLAKAEEGAGGDASAGTEVRKLAAEFFQDGVFVHDRMSFRDYLEDLADILEDMVDGDKGVEEEKDEGGDSDLEDEMEMFGEEAMKRFAVEKTERKEETERGRG